MKIPLMTMIKIQLASLVPQILVALMVWDYYRTRTFPVSLRFSTFWPRFWTGSVDQLVIWPLGFAASFLVTLDLSMVASITISIIGNLFWLLYSVLMHAKYGQTIGKMACKVKVIDYKSELPISYRQALFRDGIPILFSFYIVSLGVYSYTTGTITQQIQTQGGVLSSLQMLWYIAEMLTMLTNKKRRSIHDLIAGTVVVRTKVGELTETYTPIERDIDAIKLSPIIVDYSDGYNSKTVINIVIPIIILMLSYMMWSQFKS